MKPASDRSNLADLRVANWDEYYKQHPEDQATMNELVKLIVEGSRSIRPYTRMGEAGAKELLMALMEKKSLWAPLSHRLPKDLEVFAEALSSALRE